MKNEETIFEEAAGIAGADARAAYLERACGGDAALRHEVDGLLAAHDRAAGFMGTPAPGSRVAGLTGFPPAPRPGPEAVGAAVGPYRLLERIGEGGMGVVYTAEQFRPVRRRVALKIIKPGMDSRQVVARFEAERQALAMMDHPGIARVLDAGTTDAGLPYFAMELVEGVPVTDYCDANRLTARERLALFVQVCQAVQHAHTKGVIHRDLKPTNILVTLQDGAAVPKVIDFGVAKATGGAAGRLTDKTLFTHAAQMVGTPLYMSPEQAEFSGLDVDTRSDVYSLGVLLYELLTGTTPFDEQRLRTVGLDEVRRIIREEEPPRPSTRLSALAGDALTAVSANRRTDPEKLRRSLRGELDWLGMKALEKDRTRRYETAAAFAADVRRYLGNEAVHACPPTTLYRFRKFARRNKRALASAAVLAVAAIVGVAALATSTVLVWRANQGLQHEAYFQRITVAHRELSIDNLAAARRALDECPKELRGWEWNYLARLCKVEPLVIQSNAPVHGVAFSPDGALLACAGGDGTLTIRESLRGGVIQTLQKARSGAILSVAFHRDGKHVATRGADGMLKVWDWTTRRVVFEKLCETPSDNIRPFGSACMVAFSPNGRQLAAGYDGAVNVWDWENDQRLHRFAGHGNNVISVAYSTDGRCLASVCTGEGVKLWDPLAGGPPLRTFGMQRQPFSGLAFRRDGVLATASLNHHLQLWNTKTAAPLPHPMVQSGPIESVAFRPPDGLRLASAGEDKTVRLWDPESGREVLGLRGHTDRCGCVAFSPDGWRLASASMDGTIRVWDAAPLRPDEHQEAFTFTGHKDDEIRTVVVSPTSGKVASAGQGTAVKVWDWATSEPSRDVDFHNNVIFSVAWHPNLERIAAAGWQGELHNVQVRDARSGAEVFTIWPGPEKLREAYYAVAFSRDGRYLVTGSASGTGNESGAVQVWDAATGAPVVTLGKHNREVRGVVFSPDGRYLASASSDGVVKLWDATRLDVEQTPLYSLPARVPGSSSNVAFSPDSTRMAIGGDKYTIKVWDVRTGMLAHTLMGHRGDVYGLAFSPDKEGRWIASASEDSTVKIWDSRTEELVRNFRGHTALVSSVAFGPGGAWLVSGSRDHTANIWDLSFLDRATPSAGGK